MKCPNCGEEIPDLPDFDDRDWVYCDEDGVLRHMDTNEPVREDEEIDN